jgi:hypothetical protein
MAARTICFAALPAACPALWQAASRQEPGDVANEDVVTRKILVSGFGPEGDAEIEAPFLAPRVLPRLSRPSGPVSSARTAYAAAERLVVLLPIGRFDDGVWAPIIEKLLADTGATRRETILAWAGIEPFLAPFGRRASDVWSDPRLVPGLLTVFERSARSLATVMRDLPSIDGAPAVRRGLVRMEAGAAGAPDRISLALA